MNTKDDFGNKLRRGTNKLPGLYVGALLLLFPLAACAGGVVTNATEANLRAAMSGGGMVTFACEGTITLVSTITNTLDTVLDATGHQIAISGGDAVRVFYVNTNVTFTMVNVTVANGWAESGGSLVNSGGTINLDHCVFSDNWASGASGTNGVGNGASGENGKGAVGGAILNSGNLTASNCTFLGNHSTGGAGGRGAPGWSAHAGFPGDAGGAGGSGGDGFGGAVYNNGNSMLVNCTIAFNGGAGGAGGGGENGGSTYFGGNFYWGGNGGGGGNGGRGLGSAFYNSGTAVLVSCTIASNSCVGANGGFAGSGGYVFLGGGGGGGNGGWGGHGLGSSLYNVGRATLVNCTLAFNSCTGGAGGGGGSGGWYLNTGQGGNGGNGGNGGDTSGGIYDNSGLLVLTNCTVAGNSSLSGFYGYGGGGGDGPPTRHPGSNGANGTSGTPLGGIMTPGGYLMNTLLVTNLAGTNGSALASRNASGSITDAGHNLSSDSSCAFTNVGSMNSTDPRLAPLTDNGGPTLTMALVPGSPAIDAGDTSLAPFIDQRGFPRPAGSAADIGAFEFGSMLPVLTIARSAPSVLNILVQGNSNQWCRLLASSNFSDWIPIDTNQIDADGKVLFNAPSSGASCRFYRVAMP